LKVSKRQGDAPEDDEVSNEGALDFGYQLLMECENENSEYLNDFLADVIHKICIYPFFLYFERLSNYICNNTLLNWKANSVRKDIEWLKDTIQKVKMKHSTILSEPVISDGIFTYLRYLKFYLI
jgi:hypothetical protein